MQWRYGIIKVSLLVKLYLTDKAVVKSLENDAHTVLYKIKVGIKQRKLFSIRHHEIPLWSNSVVDIVALSSE